MLESPTFWTLVAFLIFLGLTVKPISKLAATALDARSDKIRAEIEEGEKLLEEAQELLSNYERKQRDSAKEAEAEFSGVNLDTEAAALLEFQQAYQASARILSTARELFQSLMEVV